MEKYLKVKNAVTAIVLVAVVIVGSYFIYKNNKKDMQINNTNEENKIDSAEENASQIDTAKLSKDQKEIEEAFFSFKTILDNKDVDGFQKYLLGEYPDRADEINKPLDAKGIEEGKKILSVMSITYANSAHTDFTDPDTLWIVGPDDATVRGLHKQGGEEYTYKFLKVNGVWYVNFTTK